MQMLFFQSDGMKIGTNIHPEDWNGFVAYLGTGNDALNVEAGIWQYDAAASVAVAISNEMIEFIGLNFAQVTELRPYVFTYTNSKMTIWTDAETVQSNGQAL